MANPPRTRRRVHAIRRAPDGSAYQKCHSCGVLIAISLSDMHECEADTKTNVKRFKGLNGKQNVVNQSFIDKPRSPFRFFMESFMLATNSMGTSKNGKPIDIDRKGFETWRNMSEGERQPYIIEAKKVNSAYVDSLIREVDDTWEVDDEADSAMVGKCDPFYEDGGYSDNSDSFASYKGFESFNTWKWEMVKSWVVESSH